MARICIGLGGLIVLAGVFYLDRGLGLFGSNEEYLVDIVGGKVIDYRTKHGDLPQDLESISLMHRGDKYGNTIAYLRLNANSFLLATSGDDGMVDLASHSDDLYYLWSSTKGWSEVRVDLSEQINEDNMGLEIKHVRALK